MTNLVKKSQKAVKGKSGKDMLADYMENADVMISKINKMQNLYPNTVIYPNPLLHDEDVDASLKGKIQRYAGGEDGEAGEQKQTKYQHKMPAKCFLDERSFII